MFALRNRPASSRSSSSRSAATPPSRGSSGVQDATAFRAAGRSPTSIRYGHMDRRHRSYPTLVRRRQLGGTAPGIGDDLVFPNGPTFKANSNDFGPGMAFGSIDISATATL